MLTRENIELLLDLVENRIDIMEVVDREDRQVAKDLETCRRELAAAIAGICGARPGLESNAAMRSA